MTLATIGATIPALPGSSGLSFSGVTRLRGTRPSCHQVGRFIQPAYVCANRARVNAERSTGCHARETLQRSPKLIEPLADASARLRRHTQMVECLLELVRMEHRNIGNEPAHGSTYRPRPSRRRYDREDHLLLAKLILELSTLRRIGSGAFGVDEDAQTIGGQHGLVEREDFVPLDIGWRVASLHDNAVALDDIRNEHSSPGEHGYGFSPARLKTDSSLRNVLATAVSPQGRRSDRSKRVRRCGGRRIHSHMCCQTLAAASFTARRRARAKLAVRWSEPNDGFKFTAHVQNCKIVRLVDRHDPCRAGAGRPGDLDGDGVRALHHMRCRDDEAFGRYGKPTAMTRCRSRELVLVSVDSSRNEVDGGSGDDAHDGTVDLRVFDLSRVEITRCK